MTVIPLTGSFVDFDFGISGIEGSPTILFGRAGKLGGSGIWVEIREIGLRS